jgi:hypothetical protein
MTASKAGAVYLVDIKYLEEAVVQRLRAILEDAENNSRLAKVKALGLLPGSRSYKCEVAGVRAPSSSPARLWPMCIPADRAP